MSPPENPARTYPITTHLALPWQVMSRTYRALTIKGRHFLAMRCRASGPWTITETDQDITTEGRCKSMRTIGTGVGTYDMSQCVFDFLGPDTAKQIKQEMNSQLNGLPTT